MRNRSFLTLTLLVARLDAADDPHDAISLHNFAVATDFLN
jgi:hypothetical protein